MYETVLKNEFYFQSTSNLSDIHAVEWLPQGEAKAVLQIAHGVAEYIERYEDFASFLTTHGFAVVGNDHLGHGKSFHFEDEMGWFGDDHGWHKVCDDMKKLYDLEKEKFPNVPYFLLGHSMGSFLARTYIIDYPDDLDGVIISGTGWQHALTCDAGMALADMEIRLHGSKYRSDTLQKIAFGGYLKNIENPATENDWISRDAELVKRYTEDTLCGYIATAGLMREMMYGIRYIGRDSKLAAMNRSMPVFFFSGAEDPVGDWSKGVQQTAASFLTAGMTDVTVKLYEGGRHEMLNEINKQEVYEDVLAWLQLKMR